MAYKIYLNLSNVNMGELCKALGEIGDVIFFNNCFYIWTDGKADKNGILFALSEIGITEVYCEEIIDSKVSQETGFAFAWLSEHFKQVALQRAEDEHQSELRQMLDNIQKANELLEQRIKQFEEEQANAGGKNGKAQKRKTPENKG